MTSKFKGVVAIKRADPKEGGWQVDLVCGHMIYVRRIETIQQVVIAWTFECFLCEAP